MSWWSFKPYVSVAQRRAMLKEVGKLAKKGQVVSPVKLDGKKIASTFWGKAWCDHLESYSDFASRLPRGRTYVRNGSVVDLQIRPGSITALVSGSELYRIKIAIAPLPASKWDGIRRSCAGQIASVIELLKGRVSEHVMRIVTNQSTGLFPSPKEIAMECSCPDWAGMCKHVAATLYGVGARLDKQPELLFLLRKVDQLDLVAQATDVTTLPAAATGAKTIAAADLGDVFGIELNDSPPPKAASPRKAALPAGKSRVQSGTAPAKSKRLKKAEPQKRPAAKIGTRKAKVGTARATTRSRQT